MEWGWVERVGGSVRPPSCEQGQQGNQGGAPRKPCCACSATWVLALARAQMIKGKTPEEIRKTFNIKNEWVEGPGQGAIEGQRGAWGRGLEGCDKFQRGSGRR